VIKKDSAPPNIFKEERRNFDYLLIGSTKLWHYVRQVHCNEYKDNQVMSFAFFKRSLYAVYLILQHMFSWLKENGTVIVAIDIDECQREGIDKLNYSDFRFLHPVTIKEIGVKFWKFKRIVPLLFYPVFSIRYFFYKMQKKIFW
jgi:hypothetical protein